MSSDDEPLSLGCLPLSADVPPGEYVLLRKDVYDAIVAELVAHPDIFRSVGGELRSWGFRVGETTADSTQETREDPRAQEGE